MNFSPINFPTLYILLDAYKNDSIGTFKITLISRQPLLRYTSSVYPWFTTSLPAPFYKIMSISSLAAC